MLKLKKHTLLILAFLSLQALFAQQQELLKARNYYKKLDYVRAIKAYEAIASKGGANQEVYENLGNAYYFNADYKNAYTWYEKLFSNPEYKLQPEYYYRYAQTLKTVDKYDQSNKVMEQFVALTGDKDSRAQLFTKHKDYYKEIQRNSGRLNLHPLSINSKNSEYGTAFYGDKVVFSASKGILKGKSKWTGDAFYDLYEANRDSLEVSHPRKMGGINTKFNESTAAFTTSGDTVYFTRNNYVHNKLTTDGEDTVLLKILRATKDQNGNWGHITEMPFNSNIYSVAHPALSPDGKYIYFTSNMKGSLGNSDIYRAKILKTGYGKAENLGALINTTGRESFPFISKDSVLYYSSDGFPGLGGLDIFAVKLYADGTTSKPVNIGKPANSAYDDFCYVIDNDKHIGFLTSNRLGGKGKDDIYSFYEQAPVQFDCTKNVRGMVKDAQSQQPITETKLTLLDTENNPVEIGTSNENGQFALTHDWNCKDQKVLIKAEKNGYVTVTQTVTAEGNSDFYAELLLQHLPETPKPEIKVGVDLAKTLAIQNIYFDFDKADIRPDAAEQLSKLVAVLNEYPTIKIDIRVHTDSRGSDAYNLALSHRRAKSTMQWLIAHGIDKKRLTAKGYGETRLTNHCANGVPCSEEEHQANRRSEFIIISL
jgi:ompA/motB domain protein